MTPYGTVRILAVFGNSEGINLEEDKKQLNQILSLPEADVVLLDQPDLQTFTQTLYEPEGWDIFFFAGHSVTNGNEGLFYVNSNDALTISAFEEWITSSH